MQRLVFRVRSFWGFVAAYSEFSNHISTTSITRLTQFTRTLNTPTPTEPVEALASDSKENLQSSVSQQSDGNTPVSETQVSYQIIKQSPELDSQENVLKKNKYFNAILIGCSIVIVVCALFVSFLKDKDQYGNKKQNAYKEGSAWFSVGDYLRAMRIWEQEQRNNQISADDKLLFQTLKFQLNDDILHSAAFLNFYKNKNKKIASSLQSIIQALVQIKTNNLSSVQQSLKQLAQTAPSQEIKQAAFANWALLSIKAGKCDFFKKYAEEEFGNKNLIKFAFSFCLLELPEVSAEQQDKAKETLQEITQSSTRSYYQESMVGLAYIKQKQGEKIEPVITALLDSNPYFTDEYYYNILIDRKIYSWPQLLPLCKNIYSTQEDNQLFISFYAYCLARAYNYELAQQFIIKAKRKDSTGVLIKAVHAYVAFLINLKDESSLILGDAIRSNSDMEYILPYILQARFCEEKEDWECAVKYWRLVLKNTPDSLSGLGGLAYAKYNQGYYEEAREYMGRGFAIDNNTLYSSLLFLKKEFKDKKY